MTDISKKIRQSALNYLSRRDHSRHELEQKLIRKGFTKAEMEPVMVEMVTAGYLNEQRFSENFVYYYRNKGYGPLRIAMQLQAKGILPEMIAQHIELTDNAWFISARNVWRKYCKGKLPTDIKLRAKQIRFLQYRGFTREHIECILKQQNDDL